MRIGRLSELGRHIAVIKCSKGQVKAIVTDPLDLVQNNWVRGRFYEHTMLEYIANHFQGGVFVDVGAMIGNHTLFFAAFCHPAMVIAIEPVPEATDLLKANLELNRLTNVAPFNLALSDRPGWGHMEECGDLENWNPGMWRLVEGQGLVIVTTLDNLLDDLGIAGVALVKIDAEYSESKILAGASGLLQREHPALFIEARKGEAESSISEQLAPFGYEPYLRHKNVMEFR